MHAYVSSVALRCLPDLANVGALCFLGEKA